MAENKFTKRRQKLKQNLYKLLKEREPDGIPKAHLWNIYSSKVEKISAAFYGTGKMHNLLADFGDMIYEVMEKGRPTIRLIEGYIPAGEDPPDVQIDKISSSESEENHTQAKEVKKTMKTTESTSSGGRSTDEALYSRSQPASSPSVTPSVQQLSLPLPTPSLAYSIGQPLIAQASIPIIQPTQQLRAGPSLMPQPLMMGGIARPQLNTLQTNISAAVGQFLTQAKQSSFAVGRNPEEPCVVSSSSESESESESEESEDSSIQASTVKMEKDEHKTKIEQTRSMVKKNIVSLLTHHPKGIKKSEIWRYYHQEFKQQPNKVQVGLSQLTKVLDLFTDVIEEVQDNNGIPYIRLIKKAPSGRSQLTPGSSGSSTPVIDLTKDEPSSTRGSLVDLTRDQSSSGFIPLLPSHPTPRIRGHPGDFQMQSAYSQLQQTPAFVLPSAPSQDSSLAVCQLVIRPISLRKFEEKETHLPRVWNNDRYGRFSKDQIENVAKECIEALAEAEEHVSVERVESLMLQRLGRRTIGELGHWRYANQIPCLFEHNRMLCKINAYIQAFLNTRSICTLHELKMCMAEFAPDKDSFAALQVGPLQRLPIIYNNFKFPTDMADIPEITTSDIFENLRNYLNKYQRWNTKLELEHFMEYLVETYRVENAYILGVRIRSLPLAMQVLKKSQRDAAGTRRKVTEDTKETLKQEIEQVFHRFRAVLMNKRDGQGQIREHYLKIRPTEALKEIFDKYRTLCSSVEAPANKAEKRTFTRFTEAINAFLQAVTTDSFGRNLFHIAICISRTEVETIHRQFLTEATTKPKEVPVTVKKKPPPTKESIIKLLKTFLDKCQNHGALTLKHLDHIEERITDHFEFESFLAMGYGRFLEFLIQETKQELDDCGGTSLGTGGGHGDVAGGYLPSLTHILEFIHQCKQSNTSQEEKIQQALCHQFSVKEVKQLGHGTSSRLIGLADRPGKHVSNQHCVVYEAAVIPPESFEVKGQTGILGHQTKEAALACLNNCPLLENMADWSQWSLVFEPQLGKLRDFIQKYGECQSWPVEGGSKIMNTDFIALESSPGQYLKLLSSSSPEKFCVALHNRIARDVSGHLMSMVIQNKGVENTPVALLANHVREELFKMHGEASKDNVPGAPSSCQPAETAVHFVLDCLSILPVKTCSVLASQMFLDPLGQVIGQSKSKTMLLQSCVTLTQLSRLQQLGCLLGVAEWMDSIQVRCQPMPSSLQEVAPEVAEEFFKDEPEIIEDSEGEEDSSSTSYLSDVELETEVKVQEEEEMIVVDECTEIEDDVKEDAQMNEASIDLTVKSEDTVIDLLSPDNNMEEAASTVTVETDVEQTCQGIVNQIRREEFGIGVELNEDGQKLMRVQQERLGRSLDRLSKDLYSKDTHFVLELIQNADDNSYPEDLQKNTCPSVQFIMRPDGVVILNNETGFQEKNIRALCDVGRSTKGKHKAGYIGQKGIGFKSVFRVTDEPEVHSNGFHIKFDVQSGPTGYILPHWVEEDKWEEGEGWMTKIVLPIKDSMKSQMRTLAARFHDIHPSLLLFLNRLRQITIENRVEDVIQEIRRRDLGDNVVEIVENSKVDRWLVVKKRLDASTISLQAKSGVEVESTEIALAFPLRPAGQKKDSKFVPPKQPVFAFLPLRSYGFRFIIQGDFDVPSSREDVDRDSSWNQWLRNELHVLFIEALEAFKNHADFSNVEAVTSFLQFVPVEDEIIDFFRPVANQILQKLRAKQCVPTQPNSKGKCSWKIPSQTVTVKDPLVLEVVTPDLLKDTLNLFYLHRDVAAMLNSSLTLSLGIESLNTEHLLLIGKSLLQQWSASQETTDTDGNVLMTAKWMACVYRSLDEFSDNQAVYDTLRAMKIIPLATNQRQCTGDSTIFFPLSENTGFSQNDPMMILQQDLNTIHPLLVSTADSEVNSQVQKLLLKIGVCQLSPKEVICQHIMPILKSNSWKDKRNDILISYIIYIKEQIELDPSLINVEELGMSAILKTNKGLQNPSQSSIHFPPVYKNNINLQDVLPGYDWILLDPVYLRNTRNPIEIQKWRDFFIKIWVTDFIAVKQVKVEISAEDISSTPWAPLKEVLDPIQDGSYIEDWSSTELQELIQNNSKMSSYPQQMSTLCVLLAENWDRHFSKFTSTSLYNKCGGRMRDMETSFSILLRTSSWLPGSQTCMSVENEDIIVSEKVVMMQPSCLYLPLKDITDLLAHSVIYINVQIPPKSSFGQFLRIKQSVRLQDLKKFLIDWGKRDLEQTPKIFITTKYHISNVYLWLSNQLPPIETQELLQNHPVIFVPDKPMPVRFGPGSGFMNQRSLEGLQAGRMLNSKEVWWSDPTGLIVKHGEIIQDYHSELNKKAILFDTYGQFHDLKMLFQNAGRISMEPSMLEYGELLVLMGQVLSLSDKSVLSDALKLYLTIGGKLRPDGSQLTGQTRMNVMEIEKVALKKKLEGQKILATTRNKWVGTKEHPMIAENRELEKMFEKKDQVNFVVLEDRSPQPKRGGTAVLDRNLGDKLMPFYDFCGVKKLSDCTVVQEIPEMLEPCSELQLYVFRAVPVLQRFLYKFYPDIYQELQNQNISQRLSSMQFFKVKSLEVRYSLNHTPDVFVLRKEKCVQTESTFYFHRDYTECYPDINKEIAKLFSNSDDRCSKDLRAFLNELITALTKEPHTLEEIMEQSDCEQLPANEPVWSVPPPVFQVPVPIEPEEDELWPEEAVSGEKRSDVNQTEEGDQGLKAWPPVSNIQGPVQNKVRKEKEDKPADSKVWPPPKAPDYVKSVKELPSQFKVTDERKPSSGEETETVKGDKSYGGGIMVHERTEEQSYNRQDGGEGSRQGSGEGSKLSRQDSEGKGTKRKISENEAESSGENKRPVPPGEEKEQGWEVSGFKAEGSLQTTVPSSGSSKAKDTGIQPRETTGEKVHHGEGQEHGNMENIRNEDSSVTHKPGGKRRHPTDSSQGSPRVPESKRILMDHPAWTELASDYTYEELCQGSNLKATPEIPLDLDLDESNLQEIGRWGEHLVHQYLLEQQEGDRDIIEVKWCNKENEQGTPYDFELSRQTEDGVVKTFIEVKTTLTDDKDVFEISSQQIQFAQEQRENFHIYRVFNAGDVERVRLVRIDNLCLRLDQKQVRLWMMI
ncbi:uncharacterized protein LOC133204972 [Saccostrea echinata]|uniref:uncharacterized protein LOC133204972 n=1 Tax=Saccostrea echinata TaxID=191078 RepID=UPI002A807487|nr:uncharacterized protein LOC133204972 [Saccostrea echinata]